MGGVDSKKCCSANTVFATGLLLPKDLEPLDFGLNGSPRSASFSSTSQLAETPEKGVGYDHRASCELHSLTYSPLSYGTPGMALESLPDPLRSQPRYQNLRLYMESGYRPSGGNAVHQPTGSPARAASAERLIPTMPLSGRTTDAWQNHRWSPELSARSAPAPRENSSTAVSSFPVSASSSRGEALGSSSAEILVSGEEARALTEALGQLAAPGLEPPGGWGWVAEFVREARTGYKVAIVEPSTGGRVGGDADEAAGVQSRAADRGRLGDDDPPGGGEGGSELQPSVRTDIRLELGMVRGEPGLFLFAEEGSRDSSLAELAFADISRTALIWDEAGVSDSERRMWQRLEPQQRNRAVILETAREKVFLLERSAPLARRLAQSVGCLQSRFEKLRAAPRPLLRCAEPLSFDSSLSRLSSAGSAVSTPRCEPFVAPNSEASSPPLSASCSSSKGIGLAAFSSTAETDEGSSRDSTAATTSLAQKTPPAMSQRSDSDDDASLVGLEEKKPPSAQQSPCNSSAVADCHPARSPVCDTGATQHRPHDHDVDALKAQLQEARRSLGKAEEEKQHLQDKVSDLESATSEKDSELAAASLKTQSDSLTSVNTTKQEQAVMAEIHELSMDLGLAQERGPGELQQDLTERVETLPLLDGYYVHSPIVACDMGDRDSRRDESSCAVVGAAQSSF